MSNALPPPLTPSGAEWNSAWDGMKTAQSSTFPPSPSPPSSSSPEAVTPFSSPPSFSAGFPDSPHSASSDSFATKISVSPSQKSFLAPLPPYNPFPARKSDLSAQRRQLRTTLATLLALLCIYFALSRLFHRPNESRLLRDPIYPYAGGAIPATCETCVRAPHDPLCAYGIDNVRLSRSYEGSGYRVRKVIEKALRGEQISIGLVGASVTAGHGVEGYLKWQDHFMSDWMEMFPNTKVYDGSAPGMNSEFYSYCFEAFIPPTVDLVLVELDINNDDAEYTFKHDDALYRGLLQLPQAPAVVRVSVFAMSFWELARGTTSALLMSSYFDIPMIGIRNFLLPHLLLHPNETSTFFHHDIDGVETRHISHLGHRAMGDMLALYFRDQVCETMRRLGTPDLAPVPMWPQADILSAIPNQHLWTSWNASNPVPPIHPSCSLVGNKWHPLTTLSGTSPTWEPVEWNGKSAVRSSSPGSRINIPFTGSRVGIFVYHTNGIGNELQPGRILCFVDGMRAVGTVVDAYHDWEYSTSRWNLLKDGMELGDHVLTCEILRESSTSGHEVRILGIGMQ